MKSPTPPAVLERSIDEHIVAAQDLLNLLAHERAVLESANAEQIARTCRDKAAALARLSLLSPMLKKHGSAIVLPAQRETLLDLLRRCHRENLANGVLLEARAVRVRRALSSLQGQLPAQGYDRRGRCGYALPGRVDGRA
ncbi:MAG: flagellar export chaperone FlgN [Nevskia sp.]|nr:flagellar export chaperone FlgN [Nevskia sp.]